MFARLRTIGKALRLYEALSKGDTALLVELFPFVKTAFTPRVTPVAPVPKPLAPPKVTLRARSEEDDLRDALDIGFGAMKFEKPEKP
jgi:hypothetical protein